MYDETYDTLSKILSSSTVNTPDEYGVCNNEYKFRYIKPENIASYASYLMKALKKDLISPNINDMEKFAVQSVKNFMKENKCTNIENSSIYGIYRYTSDTMTLKDLILLCENDVYHTSVCSKYDMTQRKASIKKDWNTITELHFSTNVKKMVNAIPTLMKSTDYCEMDHFVRDAICTYIESFILFSIMMNAITLSNMTLYCTPKSSYNMNLVIKPNKTPFNSLMEEDDEVDAFVESVDVTKNKPIYCIFVEGNMPWSHAIQKFTNSPYSHVMFAFDDKLTDAYAYDMVFKKDQTTGNTSGFHKTSIKDNRYDGLNMTVFSAYVSNDNHVKLEQYVESFNNTPKSSYDFGIILNSLFHKDKKPSKSEYKQVCSTFVDSILKQINVNISDKSIPSPQDLASGMRNQPSGFVEVYSGTCRDYNASKITKVLTKFAAKKRSHAIGEVVTECCLLKTNNLTIRNKIPFNINMRDIILGDAHPQFKDTRSAIHFITKDSRSPISQLLIKYSSNEPSKLYVDPMTVINLFGHCRDPFCANKDEYAKHHELDFHTDVNWLDKIAYGNNFLNGNYRMDGVGNHHMDPIHTSLDMLYRMYGDCALVESKELADHIIKVSSLMKAVIQSFNEHMIDNWEMVRDILVVLGEIMTRCMIKLYNNHMTVFVASDNMDDVEIPGYLYTESFVLEADENNTKPSVQVTDSTGEPKQQSVVQKIKTKVSQLFHRFIAWVQNVLSKTPIKFLKNHQVEIKWLTNDKTKNLHDEIHNALADGSFTATTTNFPHYKIPVGEIIGKQNAVADYVKTRIAEINAENKNQQQTATQHKSLKEELYPDKLWNAVHSLGDNIDVNKERTLVTNYVLFGDPDHAYIDHNAQPLKFNQFDDLRDNLVGTGDVLEKVGAIDKDLQNGLQLCVTECQTLEGKLSQTKDEEANSTESNADIQHKLNEMTNLQKELQQIASGYHVAIRNIITSNFYPTSYTLYRDIVTSYQQQKKSNGLNAPNASNTEADKVEDSVNAENSQQGGSNNEQKQD